MNNCERIISISNNFFSRFEGYKDFVLYIMDSLKQISMKYLLYSLNKQVELISYVYYDLDDKTLYHITNFGEKYEVKNILSLDYTKMFFDMNMYPITVIHSHPIVSPLSKYLSINDMLIVENLEFPFVILFYFTEKKNNWNCRVYDFRNSLCNKSVIDLLLRAYVVYSSLSDDKERENFLQETMRKIKLKVFEIIF